MRVPLKGLKSSAPHIAQASTIDHDIEDWGDQPDMVEGQSHSSGILLWHFVSGRATYTSDDGEVIEVTPGTVVHFLKGWTGKCVVHETMRNVFMLR